MIWNPYHSDVQHHFDRHAWVSISQEFSIRELLLEILQCITEEVKPKTESHDELGKEIEECLQGNRYLIVLDDVWSTNVWQGLSPYFPAESNKSSRVLITTRNQQIAADAHSDCHKSWELFLNRVGSVSV